MAKKQKGGRRNKKLINRRNNILQGWQFFSPITLEKEGEKRKKGITTHGMHIWSPIQVLMPLNRA